VYTELLHEINSRLRCIFSHFSSGRSVKMINSQKRAITHTHTHTHTHTEGQSAHSVKRLNPQITDSPANTALFIHGRDVYSRLDAVNWLWPLCTALRFHWQLSCLL